MGHVSRNNFGDSPRAKKNEAPISFENPQNFQDESRSRFLQSGEGPQVSCVVEASDLLFIFFLFFKRRLCFFPPGPIFIWRPGICQELSEGRSRRRTPTRGSFAFGFLNEDNESAPQTKKQPRKPHMAALFVQSWMEPGFKMIRGVTYLVSS